MNKIITKTSKQYEYEKSLKDKETMENRTCPECGHYDIFNGITQSLRREGGFFFSKHVRYNIYKCKKCGCRWEIKQD